MHRPWYIAGFLALLVASGALAVMARAQPSFAWDAPVAEWVQGLQAPGVRGAMEVVSLPGTALGATVSVLVAAAVVAWRGRRRDSFTVLAVVLLDAANEVLKAIIGRPRPGTTGGTELDSFPSGHAFHSVVFLGVLWVIVAPHLRPGAQRNAFGALLVAAALLVGLSRVYLERHWPSDVLGGYMVGGVALWALLWGVGRIAARAGDRRKGEAAVPANPDPEEGG